MIVDTSDTVLVKLDDGALMKTTIDRIAVMEEPKPEEPKKEDDSVKYEVSEKELINLTPTEFRRITAELVSDFIMKVGPFSGVAFTLFVAELHKKLFFEESDDE